MAMIDLGSAYTTYRSSYNTFANCLHIIYQVFARSAHEYKKPEKPIKGMELLKQGNEFMRFLFQILCESTIQ